MCSPSNKATVGTDSLRRTFDGVRVTQANFGDHSMVRRERRQGILQIWCEGVPQSYLATTDQMQRRKLVILL